MIDGFWKEFERGLFIHTHKTIGKGRKKGEEEEEEERAKEDRN